MLATAMFALTAEPRAQAPRIGLTMGYPTAIGVIWNIGDRVAVRPEVTISGSSGDSSGADASGLSPGFNTDSFSIGAGLSALFYVRRWDALRAYVSPRFAYSHTSNTTKSPSTVVSSSSDGTSRSYTTSGSFGAEYAVGRRFGLFGELGFAYASSAASATSTLMTTITTVGSFGPITSAPTTSTVRSDTHTKTWGARSSVGVIFYF